MLKATRSDGSAIDVDVALRAYVACALGTTTHTPHRPDGSEGDPVPLEDIQADVDPASKEKAREEIADFIGHALDTVGPYAFDDGSDEQIGHDFFLDRCGHGAGFWDGDWAHGEALSAVCQGCGEVWPYLSCDIDDDGEPIDADACIYLA